MPTLRVAKQGSYLLFRVSFRVSSFIYSQPVQTGPHTTVLSPGPHDSGRANVELNQAASNQTQPTISNFSLTYAPSSLVPKLNGEVDYETWHANIDLLLSDSSSSDSKKVRIIF